MFLVNAYNRQPTDTEQPHWFPCQISTIEHIGVVAVPTHVAAGSVLYFSPTESSHAPTHNYIMDPAGGNPQDDRIPPLSILCLDVGSNLSLSDSVTVTTDFDLKVTAVNGNEYTLDELRGELHKYAAIIAGGRSGYYESAGIMNDIWALNIPILGIGLGFRRMCAYYGARIEWSQNNILERT